MSAYIHYFPNGHDLRIDPGIRDNIFVNLVNFIYNNDTPTNVCPSIHVFATYQPRFV